MEILILIDFHIVLFHLNIYNIDYIYIVLHIQLIYLFHLVYLNQKKFDTGGISANGLKDRDGFIQSVVDTLDYQLQNN